MCMLFVDFSLAWTSDINNCKHLYDDYDRLFIYIIAFFTKAFFVLLYVLCNLYRLTQFYDNFYYFFLFFGYDF